MIKWPVPSFRADTPNKPLLAQTLSRAVSVQHRTDGVNSRTEREQQVLATRARMAEITGHD